jgi:hypothetical protein
LTLPSSSSDIGFPMTSHSNSKRGNLCHPFEIILAKKGRFIHVRSQISWYYIPPCTHV